MMRSLCTLGCVAALLLAAPPTLAQDAGDVDAGDAGLDAGDDPIDPEEDAGFDAGEEPEPDAGEPPVDAGPPGEDAGEEPEPDAGQPPVDAGEPEPDAGQPPVDAGNVDAGTPPPDAGPPDAGPPPDAGVDAGNVDAGQPPSDGGLEPPDAGPLPGFDAGHPGDDCVPRCIDDQRAGRCSASGQLVPFLCGADETCEVDQCVPAALAGTTGCACRQGGHDTTIALFALLLGARLLRRRARGRGEGVPP